VILVASSAVDAAAFVVVFLMLIARNESFVALDFGPYVAA
jgi:hypothetical protein